MSLLIKKGIGSLVAFATGYGAVHLTSDNSSLFLPRPEDQQKLQFIAEIKASKEYKLLENNPKFSLNSHSSTIPVSYRQNHVGQGLLYGLDHFEIDPLVFINKEDGELVGFYRIGKKLVDKSGYLHHGILGLMLDEGLCFCGFPKLPHNRGVTGKLDLAYDANVKLNETLVLKAKVVESKGRKAVIDGHVAVLKGGKEGTILARGHCVLVEPKWFKYIDWLDLFRPA